MTPAKTFAALTLGVTLVIAGCSATDDPEEASSNGTNTNNSVETPTPTPSEDASDEPVDEPVEAENEAAGVVSTYEAYISGLYNIDFEAVEPILSEEDYAPAAGVEVLQQRTEALVAAAPELWSTIDLDHLEDPKDRYDYVFMVTSVGAMASMTTDEHSATLDESQVTIEGDRASVPPSAVIASVNGEEVETNASPDDLSMEFIKKDGKWLLVPFNPSDLY